MQQVPIIDASMMNGSPAEKAEFSRLIGQALEAIGFFVLVNHGIPKSLIDNAYASMKRLFSYSDADLARYEKKDDHQRGLTPIKTERGAHEKKGLADNKRFWMVGREVGPTHPYRRESFFMPNIWPEEVPEFRETMTELFDSIEALFMAVNDSLNRFWNLPDGTLRHFCTNGDSVMRPLFYPAVDGSDPSPRSYMHQDINWLTGLVAATGSGLQVKRRDGVWVDVLDEPGSIVVNSGIMMEIFTLGRVQAGWHQVLTPEGAAPERMSIPFFGHLHRGVVLLDAHRALMKVLQEIKVLQADPHNPLFYPR